VNGQLEIIVNSFAGKSLDPIELLELFKENSGKNKEFDHFVRSIYWNIGMTNNNPELIAALFHPQQTDQKELKKRLKDVHFTEVGGQIDLSDFGLAQTNDSTQHFLLFSDFTNSTHDSLVKSLERDTQKRENLKLTVIDYSKTNDSIKRKYALIGQPILLHFSSKGFLIDQYLGLFDFYSK
jgi:hypothetical protein